MWLSLLLQLLQSGSVIDVPALPGAAALEQMALRKLGIDAWDYTGARDRLRSRHWLPTMTVRATVSAWDRESITDDVALLDSRRTGYSGEVTLTWHLSGLIYDDHEIGLARENLQVQRAIAEATARVRADIAAYKDAARTGASREELLGMRNALLSGVPP